MLKVLIKVIHAAPGRSKKPMPAAAGGVGGLKPDIALQPIWYQAA
jgi:hypothetical protein